MSQNMAQANIQYLPQWRAMGNTGDLPVGWTPPSNNPSTSSTPTVSTPNVIANAQALNDFTVKQNQPAIASYQASKAPLQDRYKALLDTIKGNQTTAENRQTLTTGNELAKRGISNDSGVYQQEETNAVNPITQAFTGQYKDANAQQGIDMSAIDNAIAQLQAGNPSNSISAALGIGQQEQSANQFTQSQAQAKAISDAQLAFQRDQANKTATPDRYMNIGSGGLLDTQTGKVIQGIDAVKSQLTGGGGW